MKLIDVDRAINDAWLHYGDIHDGADIEQLLRTQPVVDVEPVVHAHWITFLDGEDDGVFCSHCKSDLLNMFPCIRESHLPKRCPECGAKMDEEADDE